MPAEPRSLRSTLAKLASWLDEGSRYARAGILALVLLLHLAFYQLLVRGEVGPRLAPAHDSVMRVEFIFRAPSPVAAVRPPAADRPKARLAATQRVIARPLKNPREQTPAPSASPVDATAPGRESLALDWQAPAEAEPDFQPNLPQESVAFPTSLDGPDRVRMRRQVTGQQVIEGAAQVLGFWPPGYESDPCPRVKRNIAGLMTDTRPEGRAALGEELRRQRVACRQ